MCDNLCLPELDGESYCVLVWWTASGGVCVAGGRERCVSIALPFFVSEVMVFCYCLGGSECDEVFRFRFCSFLGSSSWLRRCPFL